jgi:hypothetical protein
MVASASIQMAVETTLVVMVMVMVMVGVEWVMDAIEALQSSLFHIHHSQTLGAIRAILHKSITPVVVGVLKVRLGFANS